MNPRNQKFARYGGRGIKVCDRWMASFDAFLTDMGECPAGMSLDRIDVHGDYCPENCRWADSHTQQNNRSNNVFVDYRGERMTMSIAARAAGLSPDTVQQRLKAGWSAERALSTPPRIIRRPGSRA